MVRYVPILKYYSVYVHIRNSREGKSVLAIGNPYAPHPQNKSLISLYDNLQCHNIIERGILLVLTFLSSVVFDIIQVL